jgi:hypothetical protein
MILVGIVSALTPAPPAEAIASMIWHPRMVAANGEPGRPWYRRLTLWGTVLFAIWAALYYRFW